MHYCSSTLPASFEQALPHPGRPDRWAAEREWKGRGRHETCRWRPLLQPKSLIHDGGAQLQQTHRGHVMWARYKHSSSENVNLAYPKVVQVLFLKINESH